mmetsp:Transcript_58850/g.164371  ORF Transcript_58850/g.164371 Transcript_58850/m.164371 type:complete len:150 (+) Transcript_58850:221-670(+)|eukprot:CAMPEP_0117595688 /NCGR_PEP_ID=MMETSP0784-20121206/73896_1 /TAXON_ID=39447 /ORGANISM="" /LENGTH=149 /DNA_ID=CAMNT_0005397887 /DNA_START=137 /DNA_END=586 /DNA_ORIENTATION=-
MGQRLSDAAARQRNRDSAREHFTEVRLLVEKAKGERNGALLKWVSGPPRGIRLLAVEPGSALERAAHARCLEGKQLAGSTIVAANGVVGCHRLMDAALGQLTVELVVHMPTEISPLLQSEDDGLTLPIGRRSEEADIKDDSSARQPTDI